MVWQPTMRVWAGDEIKVDGKEEVDAKEGIESTNTGGDKGKYSAAGGAGSVTSQSMSVVTLGGYWWGH